MARQRVDWLKRRADITDSHRKRTRVSDPSLVQERHSPTVEIAVDDPEAKRKARRNITRVRQSEAWRHNNLDPMQRDAESEMHRVWRTMTTGLAMHHLAFDRAVGGALRNATAVDHLAGLEQTWRDWRRRARARRIKLVVVIMILAEPRTLREVEQACALSHGSAIEVYRRGLDLWCELRGWLRPPRFVDKSPETPHP